MSKVLKLHNGSEIPIMGLGTYKSNKGEVTRAVKDALDAGYRHIDCAWFYDNEKEVGAALQSKIKEGTIKRQDLFVTSKLWCNFHAKQSVMPMLKQTLKALKLDYLDLYLIHAPFGFKEEAKHWPEGEGSDVYSKVDYLETWEAMEECVKQDLTRSIGVSNFNSQQINRLLEVAKVKPAVNQIEVTPNINQKRLIQFCNEKDIAVVGYCPLGRSDEANLPGMPKPTIFDPKVIDIGKRYNKTAAQVVLNYLIGLGISVIPKSVTKSRIIENVNVFDFKLNQEDIEYLDSLDKNQRICVFKPFADHKYYPFNIEF